MWQYIYIYILLHFSKHDCARLSAGRLPHQIVSDFDDFCAVGKLSISAFQKPIFHQNPLRSDGVNKIIERELQIPFWIFKNGFETAIFLQKLFFPVFSAEKMEPIWLKNVRKKSWKTNFQEKKSKTNKSYSPKKKEKNK